MSVIELSVLGADPYRLTALFSESLRTGRITPRDLLHRFGVLPPLEGGAGSYSAYAEAAIINHSAGKTAWTMPSLSLALATVVPTVTSTGSTLTEASYTGYARQAIAGTVFNAASSSNPASNSTNATVTFAACTAGSSTVIGWALCDAATAGNVIMWGSCTSTVISTTQTPATVASGALTMSLT